MSTVDLTETDRHEGDSGSILGRDEMVRENWVWEVPMPCKLGHMNQKVDMVSLYLCYWVVHRVWPRLGSCSRT